MTAPSAPRGLWGGPPGGAALASLGAMRVRPAAVLFVLAMFTSSFDIFLTLDVGFNFRISQIFLLGAFLLAVVTAYARGVRLPPGFGALCLWSAFVVAFVPNTTLLVRSAGYAFWLLFNVAVVFAAPQLFRHVDRVIDLLRWYLYSFLFVALFGIVQLTVAVAGLGAPLVTQWWFPGVLPRVNGFSYEPSFFATYLLIGWALSAYLLQTRCELLLTRRRLRLLFAVLTLTLVLSTSRMGWLMMALWAASYPVLFVRQLLRGRVHRRYLRYSLLLGAAATAGAVVVIGVVGIDNLRFLMSGMGVGGTAAHSVTMRTKPFSDVLRVFAQSPIIGHSLGGVSPAIARLNGWTAGSLSAAKESEGINVFAEVLAGSGIIGVVPFVVFIVSVIWKPLRLARDETDPGLRALTRAMVAALVVELAVLQFNQNILRLYVWIHIALVGALYTALRAARVSGPEPSGARG